MLSIVTDPLQSSINKHQIMSILSNNYHAIFISIFTASVVILSIYWTSKYYQQTDLTVDDSNSTNDDTNCNQKHKQKKDIQLNRTPVNITLLHEQHQHKHKHTQLVPSPNPNPSSIPDQLKFSHSKPQNTSFKSVNIQQPKPSQPSAFTPFDDPPVFPHSNNNGFTTIRRRKTEQTIIKYPNQEPITIKKTTTEHIDIPHVALWSPFVHGLRYAVAEDQGTRQHMENRTNIVDMNPNSQNDKTYSFSLFDGHLGDEAATFCTDHLHEHVQSCIHDSNEDDIISSIRQAFHHTDDAFKKYALDHECEAGAVGVYVYYQCNANNSDLDCIYVANVGDCRAILCSKGTLSILTTDHNPKNEDEKKRCGDRIDCNSDLLSGQISVTRAIGDYYKVQTDDDDDDDDDGEYQHAKLDGLICDPHIIKHKLSKDDEFLIIACDGLWDIMDSQNAMTECRRSLRRDGDCTKAAEKLVNLAKRKSCQSNLNSPNKKEEGPALTSDNISVMVIGFTERDADGKFHIGPKLERLDRPKRLRRFGRFKRTK
eukprot:402510_1